jgi:aminopeptidase N
VREATRKALGLVLQAEFGAAYAAFGKTDAADVSGPAIARRAMKNTALGYLCAAGDNIRAAGQFKSSANMTDRLAALANLAEVADEQRDEAFAAFYAAWKNNALVLDKWFAVQARAGAPDTLKRVQALTQHPDFDLRNPNRVRALVGAFTGNQAKFHAPSGAGYRLWADTIIALDTINPQIAARLVTAMGSWRRYDVARQGLMMAELERILARETLSRNTYEMASKSLA